MGAGILFAQDVTVIYSYTDSCPKGADAVITLLFMLVWSIVTGLGPRSRVLDFTLDGASENINLTFWAFCSHLVGLRWYDDVIVHRSVSHLHVSPLRMDSMLCLSLGWYLGTHIKSWTSGSAH